MNRIEAEKLILEKLEEIRDIASEYDSDLRYFSAMVDKSYIGFNNDYWKKDERKRLNYSTILGSVNQ